MFRKNVSAEACKENSQQQNVEKMNQILKGNNYRKTLTETGIKTSSSNSSSRTQGKLILDITMNF